MRARRLLLALALTALALPARAEEVIHRFDADVRVARDGTITIGETIRVRAEGREIKRGIYRQFPLTFTGPDGRLHRVPFNLLGVTRDGRPEPHFTRPAGDSIRIYAGQESVFLRPGDYTYGFRYETARQIRWFDGRPELYWNVTGNDWNFAIVRASVRVTLPDGARPVRWTAYTGPSGARGTDFRGSIEPNGVLAAETTAQLGTREGFTIVVELPAGSVDPPSGSTALWYAYLDYRYWLFGGLGFALVFGYYAIAWHAVGRDPRRGTIIPLFQPPAGVSPALANYVRNWGFRDKWRAFTAAALSLAVRGLLSFDDRDGVLRLKTTGERPDAAAASLPPGERTILLWVHGQGGSAAIDKANGSAVAAVGNNFQKNIEAENKDRFFRKNLRYFLVGLSLTAIAFIGTIAYGGMRESDVVVLFFMGFGSVWIGLFLIPLLRAVFSGVSQFRAALTLVAVVAFLVYVGSEWLSALSGAAADALPFVLSVLADHPFPFALVMGFATLNGVFLHLLRAPTDIGRTVMDQLDGFRLYLTTAESPRLNAAAPEITAERFEALLPYAVALDAEKPWSDAFAAALARAHPGDANAMRHYQPRWHTGGSWSSSTFSNSVSSVVSGTSAALASSVPVSSGSSGFSGGGGSGGGGGGGGGGGW